MTGFEHEALFARTIAFVPRLELQQVLGQSLRRRPKATNDYEELRGLVRQTMPEDMRYAGITLRGRFDVVRALTKRLSLLR